MPQRFSFPPASSRSCKEDCDWFEGLFGFQEGSYEETRRLLRAEPISDAPDANWTIRGETGSHYQVGRFTTPSLGELQEQALRALRCGGMEAMRGKLRVRHVRGDVAGMHCDPENRHATFQVASQFNCLEMVGPSVTPEAGITRYVHDKTQGPACSIACGPATAFRNYFAEVGGGRGQTSDRQIDNLSEMLASLGDAKQQLLEVKNGYTLAEDSGLRKLGKRLSRLNEHAREDLQRRLRIGLHDDVEVTSAHWGSVPQLDKEHTVTQVFGSACSVSYSMNDESLWEPLARLVLSASYEATLWSALLTALRHGGRGGSKRVYLTCLGGGAFGNPMQWIADAMAEALSKFGGMDLEVCIVTYVGPVPRELQGLER